MPQQPSRANYVWFVEPIGDKTNGIIAQNCSAEDFMEGVLCEDGNRHNLWECAPAVRNVLIDSRKRLSLKFKIFCKKGRGQIKDVSFLYE